MIKYLFNNTGCHLTKVYRFDDNLLLQDAYKASDGLKIDFSTYTNNECDLSICWTNVCVDTINTKWNTHYAKQHEKTLTVKGFGDTSFILYKGLQIMAYRTGLSKKYYNSEDYEVVDFDDTHIMLKSDENDISIELKKPITFQTYVCYDST